MKLKPLLIAFFVTSSFCFAVEKTLSDNKDITVRKTPKQTVLVTGANRSLGLELSRQFSADGYHVIGATRSPEKAIELKELVD